MKKGAFQTSRNIFESDIWSDVVKFRIFFYIYGNAVFSEDGVVKAGIKIKRGQYLRSLRGLRGDLAYREGRGNAIKKYPLTTIQRKIKSLVNDGRITTKSTEYGTLFTVVNYALYQGLGNYKRQSMEQRRNSNGTATEQRRNNNKNVKNVKECITTANNAREENYGLILNRYTELKGSLHFSPKDEMAAKEIAASEISVEKAIKYLEDCFSEYEQRKKHSRDRINSLDYCLGYIFDKYHAEQEELNNVTRIHGYRSSNSKGFRKSTSYEQALREAERARKYYRG